MKFKLAIFDSDGVLVDSESISNELLAKMINDFGLQITTEETIARFKGKKLADVVEILEKMLGHSLPANFENVFRTMQANLFEKNLQPIEGVKNVLEQTKIAKCVASNGPKEKITLALQLTGLLSFFHEKDIFSAYEVGSWKPDPSLFLYAAKTMDVAPSDCVVIEDSIFGVQAGIAAGMTVLGYAPHVEDASVLETAGAKIFTTMSVLPNLLNSR